MKKLTILTIVNVLVVLLMITLLVSAKLSDETFEEIRKLSYKHYGLYKGDLISLTGYSSITSSDFEYEWQSIWFEDGKLIVSTNEGKWFIEMKKVEE